MNSDYIYFQLVEHVLRNGVNRDNERTGVGTKAVFGTNITFNLQDQFPLLTYRKIFYRGVIGELVSFLRGYTNVKDFQNVGCNYWNHWADKNGDLGPIYGAQWINYSGLGINQIRNVIEEAKRNPESRRLYVTAWNPEENNKMSLLPCFHGFQLFIDNNNLDLLVNMRSSDIMLGLPSDLLFHALLMLVFANELKISPRKLTFSLGDAHIYKNHIEYAEYAKELMFYNGANVSINLNARLHNISPDDFVIHNYRHYPAEKLDVNL